MDLDVQCRPGERLKQMVDARLLDLAVVSLSREEPQALILCRPQLHWVAAPGFRLENGAPVPVAWGERNCPFRAAGAAELSRRRVASREIFRNSDERTVETAVAAGIAVTVMPDGTIPDSLRTLAPNEVLPPLGKAVLQLLERPGKHSEATETVKRNIIHSYRNREFPASRAAAMA